jgi:proteasome lid subunit RPN8/RPN11
VASPELPLANISAKLLGKICLVLVIYSPTVPMTPSIKKQIISLALQTPDREVCGFIYYELNKTDGGVSGELRVRPCTNTASDPFNDFAIDPEEYLRAEQSGILCGIYHSHPGDEECFSEADLTYIEEVGLPLYLYTVGTNRWQEYIPPTYVVSNQPDSPYADEMPIRDRIKKLECLPFVWGLYDCYGLIRLYYRQVLGIHFRDYERDNEIMSSRVGAGLIMDNFRLEGGVLIADRTNGPVDVSLIRPHDVLLFHTPVRGNHTIPVHFGIFTGQCGSSMFIHQPENQLSRVEQLNDSWIRRITHIIRHRSMCS